MAVTGTIRYLSKHKPDVIVTIGKGEDLVAPRDLAKLEREGYVINDDITITYKAFLAARRQGDLPKDTDFVTWIEEVSEFEALPSRKQVEQAVALGTMEPERGARLLDYIEEQEALLGKADGPLTP